MTCHDAVRSQTNLYQWSTSRIASARMRGQHGNGTAGNSRPHAIGAAGQDDWHSGAKHKPRTVGIRQKAELLGKNISRFKIRREKNVGITSHLRVDALG